MADLAFLDQALREDGPREELVMPKKRFNAEQTLRLLRRVQSSGRHPLSAGPSGSKLTFEFGWGFQRDWRYAIQTKCALDYRSLLYPLTDAGC